MTLSRPRFNLAACAASAALVITLVGSPLLSSADQPAQPASPAAAPAPAAPTQATSPQGAPGATTPQANQPASVGTAPTQTALAPQTAQPPPAPAEKSPYGYSFVPAATATVGLPRILEIDLSDRVVRPGPLLLRVFADPTVTALVVRTMGRAISLPHVTAGTFAAQDMIPQVPFFLRGRTLQVDFTGYTVDGRSTTVSLPVTLAQ